MEVNNITATSVSALVNSPQPQPAPANEKPPEKQPEQQESTVVKLSGQAQQMSRAESQNNGVERGEAKPQEEPPGIKFMAGSSKGGNVDTFA